MSEDRNSIEINRHYLQCALKTNRLQADLLKGLERGEPLPELFLKAMKALALCAEDDSLYTNAQSALRDVYGIDTSRDSSAGETIARLASNAEKLTALRATVTDDESMKRLDVAIALQNKTRKQLEQADQEGRNTQ